MVSECLCVCVCRPGPARSNLNVHIRSHKGERPYQCLVPGCLRTFTHPTTRSVHEASHNLPCLCPHTGCGNSFDGPSKLDKHVAKVHGGSMLAASTGTSGGGQARTANIRTPRRKRSRDCGASGASAGSA